jgi:hypothetical protein
VHASHSLIFLVHAYAGRLYRIVRATKVRGYLPESVQDETQNLQCFDLVVVPLAFVIHLVSHCPHQVGQLTFAGTIKESP